MFANMFVVRCSALVLVALLTVVRAEDESQCMLVSLGSSSGLPFKHNLDPKTYDVVPNEDIWVTVPNNACKITSYRGADVKVCSSHHWGLHVSKVDDRTVLVHADPGAEGSVLVKTVVYCGLLPVRRRSQNKN